ncbi:MAG: hypothetical protein IJK04_08580, partial [Kiritimatiellae bacterium]|nr:hypothetical protein [Kiritimatiellia bacterium]
MRATRSHLILGAAAVFAAGSLFADGHPSFDGKPYVVEDELQSLDVPVEGWRVSYPLSRDEAP